MSVLVACDGASGAGIARSVRSALAGSFGHLEVLVGCPSNDASAVAATLGPIGDPRARVVPVEIPAVSRAVAPGPIAAGEWVRATVTQGLSDAAQGAWHAPLVAGDVFTLDHVTTLLDVAVEHELEFVYGRAEVVAGGGRRAVVGTWPPTPDGVVHGTELVAAALAVFSYDPDSWREGEASAFDRWRRLFAAGVRAANVEHVVLSRDPAGVGDLPASAAGR